MKYINLVLIILLFFLVYSIKSDTVRTSSQKIMESNLNVFCNEINNISDNIGKIKARLRGLEESTDNLAAGTNNNVDAIAGIKLSQDNLKTNLYTAIENNNSYLSDVEEKLVNLTTQNYFMSLDNGIRLDDLEDSVGKCAKCHTACKINFPSSF